MLIKGETRGWVREHVKTLGSFFFYPLKSALKIHGVSRTQGTLNK